MIYTLANVSEFTIWTRYYASNIMKAWLKCFTQSFKIYSQGYIYYSLKQQLFGEGNGTPLHYSCLENLVGCSPWGRKESDTTERLHLHFLLFVHWRRKWQPTPVFLPGESQGQGKPGGLPSMGSHRVGHDWSNLAAAAVCLTVRDILWSCMIHVLLCHHSQ